MPRGPSHEQSHPYIRHHGTANIVSLTSRSSTRFPQYILEKKKIPLSFRQGEGEKNPFELWVSTLLFLTRPAFRGNSLTRAYPTDQRKGNHELQFTLAILPHLRGKKKTLETLGKLTVQGCRLTERLRPDHRL